MLSSERLGRSLLALRDIGLVIGLASLVLFPLGSVLWDLSSVFNPQVWRGHGLLGAFFRFWDAGGQRPVSRTLLRLLAAGTMVIVLAMPVSSWRKSQGWWRPLSLGLTLGLASALMAAHRFSALYEWQTWAVLGALSWTLSVSWKASLRLFLLLLAYILSGVLTLHTVWVSLPGTPGRLGGFLHHPNALSTLCLMMLPLFVWRSLKASDDARLAQIVSGILLALLLLSGSLTGALILAGLVGYWLTLGARPALRLACGLLLAGLAVVANLSGGWLAICAVPVGLCVCAGAAMLGRVGGFSPAVGAVIMGACGLVLFAHLVLAPSAGVVAVGSANRSRSGGARLNFYKAALSMVVEQPVWGVGPAGFSRIYPRYQGSVDFFSRFPHCVPLEILCEWGVLAWFALAWAGGVLWRDSWQPEVSELQRVCLWSMGLLLAHCLTGVQTQFPYLLMLGAVALGVYSGEAGLRAGGAGKEPTPLAGLRVVLALVCVLGLAWNGIRMAGEFDLRLASELAPRVGVRQQASVAALTRSAHSLAPLSSEVARQWGGYLLSRSDRAAAREIASLALELDPQRAACRHLYLRAGPQPTLQEIEAALASDPVNFPDFYRWMAQALLASGERGRALELLRRRAREYSPERLSKLPDIRRHDLADQLVELYALKAILEEPSDPSVAQTDLRVALHFCDNSEVRLRRLAHFPENQNLSPGTFLQDLFDQLRDQLARPGLPAVTTTSDQAR